MTVYLTMSATAADIDAGSATITVRLKASNASVDQGAFWIVINNPATTKNDTT